MTTIDKQPASLTPRKQGVFEQYRRAKRFMGLARRCRKTSAIFTNLIAAVYPARSIVELMLEAAEKQELRSFQNKDGQEIRRKLEEELISRLPYYHLLEKIRIHDFHRFCCLPPSQKYETVFFGGPVKLKANRGNASLSLMPEGPKFTTTGNSSIKEQRPLCTRNGLFFDEESGKYVTLNRVLDDFLSAVPGVIKYFVDCYRRVE